ncbi:MAG: hypothetical protein ACLSBB_17820 [Ruthenibacterium lactatiformans]
MTTICKKRGAPRQSLANRIGRRRLRESGELYLIMLPVLVMIFIFFYMPMFGVVIAFQDYVPGDPFFAFDGSTKWVGLQHFKTFFSSIYFPRLLKHAHAQPDEPRVRLLGPHSVRAAAQRGNAPTLQKAGADSQLYALFHLHGSGRGHGGLLY